MCVYLYIHNTYTQYTHIYYVNKMFFVWDAINREFSFDSTNFFNNELLWIRMEEQFNSHNALRVEFLWLIN